MTTDVPFLKANSKNAFFTALLGLLLALSAYLILNTINPKLVDENVGLQQLSIGIPGADGLGNIGTGTASSDSDTNWAKSNNRKYTLTLKSGGNVTVAPCDTSQMQSITIFGHSGVMVQKNLVASLQRISTKWQQMSPRYPVNSVGGYNCRTIAGSNKLSYHAYGFSLDINEATNAANYNGNKGDMQASFVQLWTTEGWGWGGNWNSFKDPMHFSKGNNEGGNLQGE